MVIFCDFNFSESVIKTILLLNLAESQILTIHVKSEAFLLPNLYICIRYLHINEI